MSFLPALPIKHIFKFNVERPKGSVSKAKQREKELRKVDPKSYYKKIVVKYDNIDKNPR